MASPPSSDLILVDQENSVLVTDDPVRSVMPRFQFFRDSENATHVTFCCRFIRFACKFSQPCLEWASLDSQHV